MSTVKNYNVGQIQLDLPTPNYYHELPLLSFGDIHGTVNLSLVFNYGRKAENSNPYHIAAGYQLNLQKRLVFLDGSPWAYQDEKGTFIRFFKRGDCYMLNDDTLRVLRRVNNTYELEYADYSKEIFDAEGRIITVYDKYFDGIYGNPLYTYAYNASKQLTSIKYRYVQTIYFSYDNNALASITYDNKAINLAHETNKVTLSHFCGVNFTLECDDHGFSATAADAEDTDNTTGITHKTQIVRQNLNVLKISYLIGSDIVDETTYTFPSCLVDDSGSYLNHNSEHSQVDVTTKTDVTTRIQYEHGKPMCSYELKDNGEYADGDIAVYSATNHSRNAIVSGVLATTTGHPMEVDSTSEQRWKLGAQSYIEEGIVGDYILTGWVKMKGTNNPPCDICITKTLGTVNFCFSPDMTPYGEWKYFAYKFSIEDANNLYVFPCNKSSIELKDLKIIFNPTHLIDPADGLRRIALSEDILIYHNENSYDYLPLETVSFGLNGQPFLTNDRVYFDDILRYKINQNKNVHTNEIYYCDQDGNKKIEFIGSQDEFQVLYQGTMRNMDHFYLGKRQYTANGMITTILKDDTMHFLSCQTIDKDGHVLSSQVFDEYLDISSATVDGIQTIYIRDDDLVSIEEVDGLYRKVTSYSTDANGCPTVTVTEELTNTTTVYTLDSVWGYVKSVTLPNGQVITDEYDDGAMAMLQRTFAANGRSILYNYTGGNLSSATTGNVTYDFLYTKDYLSGMKKNSTLIEEHEVSELKVSEDAVSEKALSHTTQITSYYPYKNAALFSNQVIFDKYGRLHSVAGLLSNTYRVNPFFYNDEYDAEDYDNGSSQLATSTDLITGHVTKFAYEDDRLTHMAEFVDEESTEALAESAITYDEAGRVTGNTYVSDAISIRETRGYVTSAGSVNADTRTSQHAFFINNDNIPKTFSTNNYDGFKRLSSIVRAVGLYSIRQSFTYTNTRLSGIIHSNAQNDILKHNYTWNCDNLGRTTSESDSVASYANSYVYDTYGQLIRENNGHLGRTILYTYDALGNITKAQKYAYTTGEVTGTPTEDTYTYSTTAPDTLATFNSKPITYNSCGCVSDYDGWTYGWNKGKLGSIQKGGIGDLGRALIGGMTKQYTFKYDGKGQRIQKKYTYFPGLNNQQDYMSSCTSDYTYDFQGRLLSETRTLKYSDGVTITKTLQFLYEESEIVGVIYTSENVTGIYYYDKNPKGDIVGIVDNTGNTVVKYAYDAFGNCTCYYSTNDDLANSNPIRYRSYYFDADTGLYYLNARYYSPAWRRFISPDDTAYLDIETVNGLNLYAYCGNDPVNYYDPSGHSVLLIVMGILAAAGLITTSVGVATDNNIVTAIGLTAVALPALISGGMAFSLLTPIGIGVGATTIVAGVGTALFASAEYQEALTDVNWMLNAGMNESWYNGLMLATSTIATLGTTASSIAYALNMNRLIGIGRIRGIRAAKGYPGIRFIDKSGAVRSLEIHTAHNSHGLHLQLNNWWLNMRGYEGQYYKAFSKRLEIFKFWKGWH